MWGWRGLWGRQGRTSQAGLMHRASCHLKGHTLAAGNEQAPHREAEQTACLSSERRSLQGTVHGLW